MWSQAIYWQTCVLHCIIMQIELDLELKDLSVDCKLINHNIYEFALYFATCTILNPEESLLFCMKATVSRGVLFPSLIYFIIPIFG